MKNNIITILTFIIASLSYAGGDHDHASHAGHDHAEHEDLSHNEYYEKSAEELIELFKIETDNILKAHETKDSEKIHETIIRVSNIVTSLKEEIAHSEIAQKQRATGMANNLSKLTDHFDKIIHQEKFDQIPKMTGNIHKMLQLLETYLK